MDTIHREPSHMLKLQQELKDASLATLRTQRATQPVSDCSLPSYAVLIALVAAQPQTLRSKFASVQVLKDQVTTLRLSRSWRRQVGY